MRGGRLLSRIKNRFVPRGKQPFRVVSGLNRGLTLGLDLRHHTARYLGIYEREIQGPIGRLAAGIRTAIDVGAGSGQYTLYFAGRTPAGTVFAFEPDASERRELEANAGLNHLGTGGKIALSPKLVGAQNTVDMTTLDALLPSIVTPCLVKIDVEGHESEVLDGARRLLDTPNVRWVIETHSAEQERRCADIFRLHGYTTRIVPNAWWRAILPEHRPIEHNRWLTATRPTDRID